MIRVIPKGFIELYAICDKVQNVFLVLVYLCPLLNTCTHLIHVRMIFEYEMP